MAFVCLHFKFDSDLSKLRQKKKFADCSIWSMHFVLGEQKACQLAAVYMACLKLIIEFYNSELVLLLLYNKVIIEKK